MDQVALVEILTGPIAMMLVGYVIIVVILAYALDPLRTKLADDLCDMLDEEKWNEEQRAELSLIAQRATSFVVGLALPIAVISVILDDVLKRPDRRSDWQQELADDPRFVSIVLRFCASVLGTNPLAALVTIPLMITSVCIQLAFRGASARDVMDEAVEEPTLRALSPFVQQSAVSV